jgi:hypothetical protein
MYEMFRNESVTIKQLIELRQFSETTVRRELRMLELIGLIDIDKGSRPYRYMLKSEIRNLSPPQIEHIYAIPELNRYQIPQNDIQRIRDYITNYTQITSNLKPIISFLAQRDEMPAQADVLLVLGSGDTRVPKEAAHLYMQMSEKPRTIVFSGGIGRLTPDSWKALGSEAEMLKTLFIEELRNLGLSQEAIKEVENNIIIEGKSTNTGENLTFARELLKEKGVSLETVILIQTPLLQRRSVATFEKEFGRKAISHTYLPDIADIKVHDLESFREIALGEIERIKKYGPSGEGFMVEVNIPDDIINAAQRIEYIS